MITSGNIDAVLFDLDGTLTDSGPGIANSVSYALAELGLPPMTALALRSLVGPPLRESFEALGVDPVAAIAKYREHYVETGMYENSVYAGIPDLLSALIAAGARLAVATSKPTVFARRILDHFGLAEAFEAVHGDNLDGSRRHKHLVIAAALDDLRLDAATAVMIGDRSADAVGAARCDVAFIGAGWGYAEPGEFAAAGATEIAATPADLLPRLLARAPTGPELLRPPRPPE